MIPSKLLSLSEKGYECKYVKERHLLVTTKHLPTAYIMENTLMQTKVNFGAWAQGRAWVIGMDKHMRHGQGTGAWDKIIGQWHGTREWGKGV